MGDYIITETQWDGVEGHDAVIGAAVQEHSYNQARFEFLYRSAYAIISSIPYHTIEMKTAAGERIDIARYTPDRFTNGGGNA